MGSILLRSPGCRSLAALAIAGLFLAGPGRALADAARRSAPATGAPPARVRFQIRSECTCASCGFALQAQLRKQPGIERVDIMPRERMVAVTFDESRVPLSRVAALVAGSELGKHSALIGDLADPHTAPAASTLAHVPGVRAAAVEPKKGHLLVELADGAPITTEALTAALAKAGVTVRFDMAGAMR